MPEGRYFQMVHETGGGIYAFIKGDEIMRFVEFNPLHQRKGGVKNIRCEGIKSSTEKCVFCGGLNNYFLKGMYYV